MSTIRKKLLIVGDGACGKTCLLICHARDEFPEVYIPTVFESYMTEMEVDKGKILQLALWDSAGQEEYERLRTLTYPDTDVVIICYAVDAPESLEAVREKWHPEVRHFCPGVPVIMVATKVDLRTDDHTVKDLARLKQTPVTEEEGKEMAEKIGARCYIESSALTKEGVMEIFREVTKCCLEKRQKKKR